MKWDSIHGALSLMHFCCFEQYPVLSDINKETFKAYGIGRGILGLVSVARVTFIVDKKGIIRLANPDKQNTSHNGSAFRDALDATINYGAHSKFVEKWLEQLDEEGKKEPTATATAEAPVPAPASTETTDGPLKDLQVESGFV